MNVLRLILHPMLTLAYHFYVVELIQIVIILMKVLWMILIQEVVHVYLDIMKMMGEIVKHVIQDVRLVMDQIIMTAHLVKLKIIESTMVRIIPVNVSYKQ